MNSRRILRIGPLLAVAFVGFTMSERVSAASDAYEVWATDQSGTAGRLFIYDGDDLTEEAQTAMPEVVDLGGAVSAQCLADTGTTPTRAHILVFNASGTHAILSYVATGHVVFMDAATRAPIECIDVGVQAHAAFPSPDERYLVVANQNGKKMHLIDTDYGTDTFTPAAVVDLVTGCNPTSVTPSTTNAGAACEDAIRRPNNVIICPVIDSSSTLTFATLGGGGMFVYDTSNTSAPALVAEYEKAQISNNGCGGMQSNSQTAGRIDINAGGPPRGAHLYHLPADVAQYSASNPANTPAPTVVFSDAVSNQDSHGMLLNRAMRGRYLWVGDRFTNAVEVVDTALSGPASHVNTFSLVGQHSSDPAPDLMAIAPEGKHGFVALRGPCPLTANSAGTNNSVGATPGVGVIAIQRAGFTGKLVGVAP
ncbi:MAG TPA: hypothetical protein VIX41_05435, partial [Acidimicrobiales bacterium]